MTRTLTALLALGLFAGCAPKVRAAFTEARDAALAPPAPLSADWRPDLAITLSDELLARGLGAGLGSGRLKESFNLGAIAASAELFLETLEVGAAASGCEGCIGARLALTGDLGTEGLVSLKMLANVRADLDIALSLVEDDDGFALLAKPVSVRSLQIILDGMGNRGARIPQDALQHAMTPVVLKAIPPITLARLGRIDLPVRAARLRPVEDGVELHLATGAPGSTDSVTPAPPPFTGLTAVIHTDTALALARAGAFAKGPVERNLWIEPTGLILVKDTFSLGLRVWKDSPLARWWREYEVDGDWTGGKGRVRLRPGGVTARARSASAGGVDPLRLANQAKLLARLEDALAAGLPTSRTHDVGGTRLSWQVTDMADEDGLLRLKGDVVFEQGLR